MTDSTSYNQLDQAEHSDEDWNDDVSDMTSPVNAINAPEVVISPSDKLLNNKSQHNGTAYEFSRSRNRRYNQDAFCTPTRAAICLAMTLLLFGCGYIVGFVTPYGKSVISSAGDVIDGIIRPVVKKRSDNWRTKMTDWGTESCIRLVDVDQDGVLDVIVGLALGKDITSMLTEADMQDFCRDNGLEMPCAGAVIALRGRDGKLLWKANAYAEVFELLCHGIDVNSDGIDDCIVTGRLAEMRAINPLNGEVLWEADTKYLNRGWNIYAPAAIPDVDEDGVRDLVIAHGGDPTVSADVHARRSGHIVMVSGRTGKAIGSYMKTPNEKETYMSPVIHTRKDGSQYILIGTGGETVGGKLIAMSIPDFYRYVKGLPRDTAVGNTQGSYTQWGFKEADKDGAIDIYMSPDKGVMVPPVLIDVNKDGVMDIFVNSFNGDMIMYDGETLATIWRIHFDDRESYSTPAPGYFNDDDVIDFMVHWSVGAWPFYNTTDTIILDGRDGSVLWNLTSHRYDVSSDMVARTDAFHRDVFIFRTQGRNGIDVSGTGAIHGATGAQRILDRRFVGDGSWEFTEREVTDDMAGVLLPSNHFKNNKRAVIDKDYIECASDQSVFLAELFALDRTTMRAPIKLWERGSEKYFYKLTHEDRLDVEEVMKKYGQNHTMTENEVPWSRGKKREVEVVESKDSFCVLVQPDERTTGAIGDVDGDGKLDVVVNVVSVGVLRDEYARYVKMKFQVDIFKLSLEDVIRQENYTPINVTIHDKMKWTGNENKITTLKFLPGEEQIWGGYMGTKGDSMYRV